MKEIQQRIEPYAFAYGVSASYTLIMHDVQTYDQRIDDKFFVPEDEEEPKNLGYDVGMPGWAGKL